MKKSNLITLIALLGLVGMLTLSAVPNSVISLSITELKSSAGGSSDDVEYLIITSSIFESQLEPLALWKSQKGLNAKIEIVSEIDYFYSGYDTEARIKACIEDYYTNNGTKFVLLAF